MPTLVYQNNDIVASRFLKQYPFPNDITLLPSLIPGMILQADFDVSDPASLTRNRVGADMTAVGTPEMSSYGVTVSDTNYLNTGLDIANYNGNDLTLMTLAVLPGVAHGVLGRAQLIAPQRSRAIQTTATSWQAKWLTAAGAAQQAVILPASAAPNGEMVVARFTRNNGSGSMLTRLDLPRTAQTVTGSAATTPYSVPSSPILLGASVEGASAGTLFIRAALAISRAITDDEMAMIYSYYKNYYALKGINIDTN